MVSRLNAFYARAVSRTRPSCRGSKTKTGARAGGAGVDDRRRERVTHRNDLGDGLAARAGRRGHALAGVAAWPAFRSGGDRRANRGLRRIDAGARPLPGAGAESHVPAAGGDAMNITVSVEPGPRVSLVFAGGPLPDRDREALVPIRAEALSIRTCSRMRASGSRTRCATRATVRRRLRTRGMKRAASWC